MKTNLYKSAVALSMFGSVMLASCGDNLLDTQSPSSLDDATIFSIYDLAEGTINNIYTYYGEQNYRARFWCYYGMNTDIEWLNGSDGGDDKANMANYNALPTNSQLNIADAKEPWSNIYAGIEKANLAIQGLEAYADMEDPNMMQLYGEALTLRAMAYVDLINTWGDVPARFEPISAETANIPRTDRDVIYKQIIQDLQKAENLCAWPAAEGVTSTTERINRAFVKGLLARTCMQAAGYALRSDGENRLSTDPELTKEKLYPIALQACKDVMDQEANGLVALESDYEEIFRKNCEDVIASRGESLWEVPYANSPTARGRMVYTFGIKHDAKDSFVGTGQGGQVGPVPSFFFDFAVGDKRRDVTCVPYEWKKGVQTLNAVNKWCFGKMRYEWMTRGTSISESDDGINKIYMRYADIVLMRAELENELYGPANAAPYLKRIRERAFDASDWAVQVEQYVTNASASQETMRNAIMDERAFEFGGEMLRKADLIRWGKLKEKMDKAKENMYQLRSRQGKYADLNTTLYYNLVDYSDGWDGKTYTKTQLDIYGYNYGESAAPGAGDYTYSYQNSDGKATDWLSENQLKDEKIESLYARDPDKYMYWPIFQYNLDANPALENYSWY